MSREEAVRRINEAAAAEETELDLGGLGLTELPPELFQLTDLTELWLGDNMLTELPVELFQLTQLSTLLLSGNRLSSLPPEIVRLTGLTELYLFNNRLSSLPREIVQMSGLRRIYLHGNPLVSPPYELAVQGLEAIREYFASLEEGTQVLAEVRVILVGEWSAGKTSLTRCLRGENFNPDEAATGGIRIRDWQLGSPDRQVRCNLWDFGGQQIMHATHQFFLSRRSLYVLVLDGRKDERPEYWLHSIESFGGGSPVLVVLNKCDTDPDYDLNRRFLQEKYPCIKGFLRTSCRTGEGIGGFREALLEELDKVPLTRNKWPLSWFRAKAALERLHEPCISRAAFESVCINAGVTQETSRNVLAAFLHDLGIFIHFEEFEPDGGNMLDPKWVTGAIYNIINDPSVAERRGLLRLDNLREILRWREGDLYRYGRGDHVYLIELMKKFELCYELPGGEVLIPQLLEVSEPTFDFDDTGALRFRLHYEDFLPPSVIPRFIIKRHREIKDNLRWRTGVVLENPWLEATAVVRADDEARYIDIAVQGRERKVFLALIRLSFRELHAGFEGLKVSERLPLPDAPEHSIAYRDLLTHAEQGMETCLPQGSEKFYKVDELLETVQLRSRDDREKMLALARADREKGILRRLAAGLNRYLEVEMKLFGSRFDYQSFFEELTEEGEEKQTVIDQGGKSWRNS